MEDAEEDQRKEKQHKSRRRKSEKPGVDLISQEVSAVLYPQAYSSNLSKL